MPNRPTAATFAMPIAALFATLSLAACSAATDVGGPCSPYGTTETPCKQQIYFPTGLTMDPDGDVLYLSNGNADLRYSGGTVMAIDVHRAECARDYAMSGYHTVPAGCSVDIPTSCLEDASHNRYDPVGQASTIHASTTDHDGCRFDAFDPSILECDECPFIESVVRIGNFAGQLVVQSRTPSPTAEFPVVDAICPPGATPKSGVPPQSQTCALSADCGAGFRCVLGQCQLLCTAAGSFNRRLWLPVRGDPSITFVDVDKQPGGASLSCEDQSNTDPATPNACSAQRVTVRDYHTSVPGSPDPLTHTPLPPEPFGISLDEGKLDTPQGKGTGDPYSRLLVTHLAGGELTLINSGAFRPISTESQPPPTEQVVLDVRTTSFFAADGAGRRGAFAVAPRKAGDALGYWYATSKSNPTVALFRVGDSDVILQTFGFSVSNGPFLAGEDIRDLVFQADGARGFFLEDHPPSLFTVDTRIDTGAVGVMANLPSNVIVDSVDTCQGPSHLGLRQWTETGAAGGPDRLVSRVFVLCFQTGQVMVVDPDLSLVLDTIAVGRGANSIAFNFGGAVTQDPPRRRAYVANYIDSTISVIDLDRGSATENRVIERIGISPLPVPPS